MSRNIRSLWRVHESRHTPESIWQTSKQHRREFLKWAGLSGVGGLAAGLMGCQRGPQGDASAPVLPPAPSGPTDWIGELRRNSQFEYGRAETERIEAASYTNFYEFTGPYSKKSHLYVAKFQSEPWSISVEGECAKPREFDLDDLRAFELEERAYRHRCVETWAMCVPWTGFPLRSLLERVEPKSTAKFVEFQTFHRPNEAEYVAQDDSYPWPYREGLTIAEATNELAFIALGVFGEPLPKQHGAPVRLVVPWKYGFKGIKSIVRITLTDHQPATFWNAVNGREYDFQANVNPDVPHPRWSQKTEWMLGTHARHPTQYLNGYADFVGSLYG